MTFTFSLSPSSFHSFYPCPPLVFISFSLSLSFVRVCSSFPFYFCLLIVASSLAFSLFLSLSFTHSLSHSPLIIPLFLHPKGNSLISYLVQYEGVPFLLLLTKLGEDTYFKNQLNVQYKTLTSPTNIPFVSSIIQKFIWHSEPSDFERGSMFQLVKAPKQHLREKPKQQNELVSKNVGVSMQKKVFCKIPLVANQIKILFLICLLWQNLQGFTL